MEPNMADDDAPPPKRYPDPPRYTKEALRMQQAEARRQYRERRIQEIRAGESAGDMPEPPEAA